MFISRVRSRSKNGRKSYTSILLRQSVRVGSKVKSKTLAVLTHLPAHVIQAIETAITQPADSLAQLASSSPEALRLRTAESFGAVWTVHQIAQRLGVASALGVTAQAALSYWQVLARVLRPGVSLLAMVRLATTCAAAGILGWRKAFSEDDLYRNGAWLEGRHAIVERRLWQARKAQADRQLFLYDVTSSYLEGMHNALGDWGYNRDGKKGKKQLVVGLLTDGAGEPVSIQVYRGNTSDLNTFADQVQKVKSDFAAAAVTFVGDRGMIRARQQAAAEQAGFHFITALTKAQIRRLLRQKVLQMDLFEEQVGEVVAPRGQRYILRRNPTRQRELEQSRQEKRQALETAVAKANLYLAEHKNAKVATQEKRLRQRLVKLGLSRWLRLQQHKRSFSLEAEAKALEAEALLDGCYVIQTDLSSQQADKQTVHERYKDLAHVERDFRTLKSGHLEFRPWFIRKEENTQAHALTSMLALKVRRHLERAWEKLEVTVEEGLRELETLCVIELLHPESGQVVARQLPEPSARQKQLLDALDLKLPSTAPKATVSVGTRKKIQHERKSAVK
jgi:transposase